MSFVMRGSALALSAMLACFASAAAGNPPGATPPAPQATAAGAVDGKTLFTRGTTPSCATCHTLRDAAATGNIGPDLDALKPDAARVRSAVDRGFENMPAFGQVLSPEQMDALARYVARVAGSGN